MIKFLVVTILLAVFARTNGFLSKELIQSCKDYELLPHSMNCNEFYFKCSDDEPFVMTCPDGLAFNPKRATCDWPENSKCVVEAEQRTTVCEDYKKYPYPYDCTKYYFCLGTELYMADCTNQLLFNKNLTDCDLPANVDCDVPEEVCVDNQKYPHPYDCNKYYECSGAELYQMDCPNPLLFNEEIGACDREGSESCRITTTTEEITTTSTPTTSTEKICDDYTQHPYPWNCNQFYFCLGNTLHLMQCPIELEFNAEIKWCDYSEQANCLASTIEPPAITTTEEITTTVPTEEPTTSSTTDEPTTTTEEPTTTVTTEEPTTTTEELTTITTTEEPTTTTEAPVTPKPVNCNEGMYHPHPYDCGKYYQCSNCGPIEMVCPSGLHFNPSTNVCDCPTAAGCTAISTVATPL